MRQGILQIAPILWRDATYFTGEDTPQMLPSVSARRQLQCRRRTSKQRRVQKVRIQRTLCRRLPQCSAAGRWQLLRGRPGCLLLLQKRLGRTHTCCCAASLWRLHPAELLKWGTSWDFFQEVPQTMPFLRDDTPFSRPCSLLLVRFFRGSFIFPGRYPFFSFSSIHFTLKRVSPDAESRPAPKFLSIASWKTWQQGSVWQKTSSYTQTAFPASWNTWYQGSIWHKTSSHTNTPPHPHKKDWSHHLRLRADNKISLHQTGRSYSRTKSPWLSYTMQNPVFIIIFLLF